MLRELLQRTGLEPERTAALLGINPELFQEWLANQRPIPPSVLKTLSNVVGLDLEPYLQRKLPSQEAAAVTPAIWFRFRGERLVPQDREFVLLIRRLGFFINELEEVAGAKSVGWKALFQDIRTQIDIQAPPRVQGIQAANMFRDSRGLSVGALGIGEVLRSNLRTAGILVVETPAPKSKLEGCCFYVGSRPDERPCIFANTHQTTWFRRNATLLHEVAHAIFDAESAGAALDFYDDAPNSKLAEERADAFAQQVLVPRQVLQHVAQRSGIRWDSLTENSLAALVAETHTEQRTILRAALECELITTESYDAYLNFDIGATLRHISMHALSTEEYIRTHDREAYKWHGKRSTTLGSTALRLPTPYVKAVLDTFSSGEISRGKAADMLMITDDQFRNRFPDVCRSRDRIDQEMDGDLAFAM